MIRSLNSIDSEHHRTPKLPWRLLLLQSGGAASLGKRDLLQQFRGLQQSFETERLRREDSELIWEVSELTYPFAALTASVSAGRISCRSPTMP